MKTTTIIISLMILLQAFSYGRIRKGNIKITGPDRVTPGQIVQFQSELMDSNMRDVNITGRSYWRDSRKEYNGGRRWNYKGAHTGTNSKRIKGKVLIHPRRAKPGQTFYVINFIRVKRYKNNENSQTYTGWLYNTKKVTVVNNLNGTGGEVITNTKEGKLSRGREAVNVNINGGQSLHPGKTYSYKATHKTESSNGNGFIDINNVLKWRVIRPKHAKNYIKFTKRESGEHIIQIEEGMTPGRVLIQAIGRVSHNGQRKRVRIRKSIDIKRDTSGHVLNSSYRVFISSTMRLFYDNIKRYYAYASKGDDSGYQNVSKQLEWTTDNNNAEYVNGKVVSYSKELLGKYVTIRAKGTVTFEGEQQKVDLKKIIKITEFKERKGSRPVTSQGKKQVRYSSWLRGPTNFYSNRETAFKFEIDDNSGTRNVTNSSNWKITGNTGGLNIIKKKHGERIWIKVVPDTETRGRYINRIIPLKITATAQVTGNNGVIFEVSSSKDIGIIIK